MFCLLVCQDHEKVDPLDLGQWRFFALATNTLDEAVTYGKSIGLAALERLGPVQARVIALTAAAPNAAR